MTSKFGSSAMIDTEENFFVAVKATALGEMPANISYDLLKRLDAKKLVIHNVLWWIDAMQTGCQMIFLLAKKLEKVVSGKCTKGVS